MWRVVRIGVGLLRHDREVEGVVVKVIAGFLGASSPTGPALSAPLHGNARIQFSASVSPPLFESWEVNSCVHMMLRCQRS